MNYIELGKFTKQTSYLLFAALCKIIRNYLFGVFNLSDLPAMYQSFLNGFGALMSIFLEIYFKRKESQYISPEKSSLNNTNKTIRILPNTTESILGTDVSCI